MAKLSPHDFTTIRRLTPLVSIDLIIRDPAGRVLLGFRKNEPAVGVWFVPGGRVRKDERLVAAFERLLHEELGSAQALGVSPRLADAGFKGVYEHLYPATPETPYSVHYVVLAYELTARSPEQAGLPQSQHDRWRWADPAAIAHDETVHANTRAYFPA